MAELPAPVKEWTGPSALVGLIVLAAAQSMGLLPGSPKEDEVAAMDGRVVRAWEAIRSERDARIAVAKELMARVSTLERTQDRLVDRMDDQRADVTSIKTLLQVINQNLAKVQRDQEVMQVEVRAIAQSAGVRHSQQGGR